MMGDTERLGDEDAAQDAGGDEALEEFGSFEDDVADELDDDTLEPFEAGPNTREQFEEEEPEEMLWLEQEE